MKLTRHVRAFSKRDENPQGAAEAKDPGVPGFLLNCKLLQ